MRTGARTDGGAGLYSKVAEATGEGSLTVMCALTPMYEARAVRAVGAAKVREIQRAAKEIAEKEEI